MNRVVVVEPLDLLHDLVLSNAVLLASENDQRALDPGFGRRLELHLDIGGRVGAGALLDDGEVGREARELGLDGLNAGGDVGADGAGEKGRRLAGLTGERCGVRAVHEEEDGEVSLRGLGVTIDDL